MSMGGRDDLSIPLADADPQAVLPEEPSSPESAADHGRSCESLSSAVANGTGSLHSES